MPLSTDWGNKILQVTSPTTEVSGQDLHDFIEDQMASPEGALYEDILKPEGKIEDPTNPGIFSQIILVLDSAWQIQFWQGSGYTKVFGAKIVGGVNDQPLKATGAAGDISVLESPVDGVTVAVGSGLDANQDTKLTRVHDLLDNIEGTYDHQEVMRILLAAMAGKLSGADTGNIKVRDVADLKDRITMTTSEDGNRLTVVLDVS